VAAPSGALELAAPAGAIARGLLALEDGLGLQVLIGHPGVDNAEAERILTRYASHGNQPRLERIVPR
jgi:hypothetical protein